MYQRGITLILIAITLVLGESLCAQPALNQTDAKNRKQGPWQKVHAETGKVAYRTTFKDDVPIGKTERFYEDGSLQAVVVHAGKQRDRAKLYHPNGQLMAQGVYVNQLRDSVWLFFDENGKLRNEEVYKAGEKNGPARVYSENGSVVEKAIYKDNFKHGDWEKYYEDGKPLLKCHVVDGLHYEGKYTEWYPDGTKRIEGTYVDGKKESSWYEFNENGSIHVIYVYRGGKVEEEHPRNGVFDAYYPNDILRSSYTYKEGNKHGPFKEYYHQGEWKTEETKDEFGEPLKVQRLYGTQLLREGKYMDGELHGEVIIYQTNGKVSKIENYNRGVLVK